MTRGRQEIDPVPDDIEGNGSRCLAGIYEEPGSGASRYLAERCQIRPKSVGRVHRH